MSLPIVEMCGHSKSVLGWSCQGGAWEIVHIDRFIAEQNLYASWQYLPAPPHENLKSQFTPDELTQCLALAEQCWNNEGDPAALDEFLARYDCPAQDALVQRIKENFSR